MEGTWIVKLWKCQSRFNPPKWWKNPIFLVFFLLKVDVEFCWSNSSQTGFLNDLPNLGCNQGPHYFDDFRRFVKLQRSLWGISRWASKPCRFSYMVTSLGDDFATVSTRNSWRFPKSFTSFLMVFLLVSIFDSTTTPRYSRKSVYFNMPKLDTILLMVQKSQTTTVWMHKDCKSWDNWQNLNWWVYRISEPLTVLAM